MSALPLPVKSASPTTDQAVGTLPKLPAELIAAPFISQIATAPVVLSRQRMSPLPSPSAPAAPAVRREREEDWNGRR